MRRRIAAYLATIVVVMLVAGCKKPIGSTICHVNPHKWSHCAEIEYDNRDTTSLRTISFYVRVNSTFDTKELPVSISIESPDSTRCIEQQTWSFDSERTATPTTTVKRIDYRNHCKLNKKGLYKFAVTPSESIRGIEAVGLIIEKER